MNSALYAEISSHKSPFNGSGRHNGDRSADLVNLTFGRHQNWRPSTGDNFRRHSHTAWALSRRPRAATSLSAIRGEADVERT